jgi:hypothetical protein
MSLQTTLSGWLRNEPIGRPVNQGCRFLLGSDIRLAGHLSPFDGSSGPGWVDVPGTAPQPKKPDNSY